MRAIAWMLAATTITLAAGCGPGSSNDESLPTDDRNNADDAARGVTSRDTHAIKTVFVILMENHNWSDITGDDDAPYIMGLLNKGARAEAYFNPPNLHPSEPNYLWLEAGQSFGVGDDKDPSSNHQGTSQHLVNQLEAAGITWKAYAEDIDGKSCPLTGHGKYAPKHVPFVFFDDVTDHLNAQSSRCISHVRPYGELAADLASGNVPQYVFIVPNQCNDMHGGVFFSCILPSVKKGDQWLSREVPKILASSRYQKEGALFITWDESEKGEHPIGMIALSPFAKVGYSNHVPYTHSSMLRTAQEIFAVSPLLGDAAHATDLSDLFKQFP